MSNKQAKEYLVHFDDGDEWVSENDIRNFTEWSGDIVVSIFPNNQPIIETNIEEVRNSFAFDDVLKRVKNND